MNAEVINMKITMGDDARRKASPDIFKDIAAKATSWSTKADEDIIYACVLGDPTLVDNVLSWKVLVVQAS